MKCVLLEELGVVGVQRGKRRPAGGGLVEIRFWILLLAARVDMFLQQTLSESDLHFKTCCIGSKLEGHDKFTIRKDELA